MSLADVSGMIHTMTRFQKFIVSISVLVALAVVVWHFDLLSYATLENVRSFNEDHRILGPLAFILIYVTVIILLLPIIPFAILAGAVFGLFPGFLYISVGAIIGASVAFYVARHFGRGFVEKISRGKFKKIDEYDRKIEKDGFRTVLLIRLIPLSPFKSPNYLLGFTKIRSKDYALGTILGILPESFVFAYLGASFSTLSPGKIAMSLLVVGALSTVGFLLGQKLRRKK
jgi:uncharacterized membrane protein YdjX (TVP38/TMEM64 family)